MPWYKLWSRAMPTLLRKPRYWLTRWKLPGLDQAPDAALCHSSSISEHLFFVSPALGRNAQGTLNRFHAVQCYPPTIAHLSQVIPGPKGKAPTPTAV